ncbi:MAG TPA: VOC family protein [Solirubrobacteraceae bacterium]|jgi:catechol 2,3-dioxygenase|nr:VOC family protein [Solirubrobacteraceae bacterium]
MSVPTTNPDPPCRFVRASHATFTSRDVAKSRVYYTEVLGLVVSDEDKDSLYLRGLEERAHHSLTIKRTEDEPACVSVGMRVRDEDELDRAQHAFEQHGLPCRWADDPFQGRALHTVDVVGTPLEVVASMTREPRVDTQVQVHKGAASRRFDHYQVTVPDVAKAVPFYTSLGFRIADYMTVGDEPVGVFFHVKNSPYDLVVIKRDGPAMHHFGYIVADVQSILRACDTLGELGWGEQVEFGPGKHTLGHSYYVYLRDPDGHRVELLLPPIVYMDGDDPPVVHDVGKIESPVQAWGLPPRASWVLEASPFLGREIIELPGSDPAQPTLEQYLGSTALAAATATGA